MKHFQRKVTQRIYNVAKTDYACRRIFLPARFYRAFKAEVEPIYKQVYGELISSQQAQDEGYENILYMNRAICLRKD